MAQCESGLKHKEVFGDHGVAYGVFQFHEATFNSFRKTAGMPELEYKDLESQIKLASWAFDNNLEFHWTCYRMFYGK